MISISGSNEERKTPVSPTLMELIESLVQEPEIWLNTSFPQFGNRKPTELIGTKEEIKVYNLLRAVELGLF